MADAKLSSFPIVAPEAGAFVPLVQSGANALTTVGQLKTFVQTPVSTVTVASFIPLTNCVGISGLCILPAGIVNGTKIILMGTGVGKITAIGLLPSDGFTFIADQYVELFWYSTKWNVLTNSGMTPGIV